MPREWLNSPGQSHGPSLCSTCWHCFPNTWLENVEEEVTKTGLRENGNPVLRGSSFDVWENLLGTSARKLNLGQPTVQKWERGSLGPEHKPNSSGGCWGGTSVYTQVSPASCAMALLHQPLL